MAQNTDSRFGLTAASLGVSKDIIFETFTKLSGITRAYRIKDVMALHIGLIGSAVKAAVAGQQGYVTAKAMNNALMAAGQHFTVGGRLLFEQFPVNDQPIRLFGKKEGVAEFNFRPGFTTNHHMDILFIKAQYFVFVVNLTFADDTFMSLFDYCGQLAHDTGDLLGYLFGFPSRNVGGLPLAFKQL